jgi:HSP20 family protein
MLTTSFPSWTYTYPFSDVRRLQGAMNQIFDGNRGPDQSGTYPAVNFWTGQDSVVMSTELPGFTDHDIEITVMNIMISIRGTFPEQQKADELVWLRRERPVGTFLRSIELPFRIDPEHIDARFENGVLTVEMERPEADKPKRIQIKES